MRKHSGMRPQDVPVLLKIIAQYNRSWVEINPLGIVRVLPKSGRDILNKDIASQLQISPSEVTESLARSAFAGLYDPATKHVMARALLDFLQYGIKYVFPQQPGALVRGMPTQPLCDLIQSNEPYVWPDADGAVRGQAIEPLYPTAVQAATNDPLLYEMLALIDAIRVGKSREVNLAVNELSKRILLTA